MKNRFKFFIYKPSEIQLWIEFVVFYLLFPLSFLTGFYKTVPLMPVLIVIGILVHLYLASDKSFDNKILTKIKAGKQVYLNIALVFVLSAGLMTLLIWLIDTDKLFSLIKTRPWLLLLISVFYPLFSVVPQGLAYRAMFFHRYGRLFPTEIFRIIVSAVLFSLGHSFYKNIFVLLITLVAGLLFAYRYRQTNSLLVSVLEHSALGVWLFACGLGTFFVSSMVD